MPTYGYQAKKGPKEIIEGSLKAQSRDEVVSRLLLDGLVPVSIVVTGDEVEKKSGRASRVRVSTREVRWFTRQLTSLLKAKLELVPAVTILKEQGASGNLRVLLDDLEGHMRDGNSFSDALARHPRVFNSLFRAAIRAGESAGKLDDILIKLVEFGEQQEQLESRFKSAMVYPVLLLILGIGCIGFFLWFVVPRMADLFAQLGGALPLPTQILLDVSDGLINSWKLWLAAVVCGGIAVRQLFRFASVHLAAEWILSHLPIISGVIQSRQVGRFARTMQLLLQSGIPVFQAMDAARPTLGSAALESRMRQAQESVKHGEGVAVSLQAAKCLPPLVIHMIAVGESSGNLVDVLDELASFHERSFDDALRIAAGLLEPLMIVVMGVLVGFCVLAMVLPILQLNQMVR